MPGQFFDIHGIRVFQASTHGPELRTAGDAVNLISAAAEESATWILIPIERLGNDFFELKTRIAGELMQKFSMYRKRVAILGDVSHRMADSKSLSALVAESNRGRDFWFVGSRDEFAVRVMEGVGDNKST
jgi:hypothetical protein